MGFNGGEAGGDACVPGQAAYTGQTLSHSPLKKGGGEKNSLICTKNCSNYPIYFAIPYKMTTFASEFFNHSPLKTV